MKTKLLEEKALREGIAAFVVAAIVVNKGKVLILKRKQSGGFLPGFLGAALWKC